MGCSLFRHIRVFRIVPMNRSRLFFLLPLLLAGCHPPESVVDVFSAGKAPVLDSVVPKAGGGAEFRFHASDGNVVVLHRDILESAALLAPSDVSIDIDPARQKAGALFTDHRSCEGAKGPLKIRAHLIDANHNHSNPVDYIVECGG